MKLSTSEFVGRNDADEFVNDYLTGERRSNSTILCEADHAYGEYRNADFDYNLSAMAYWKAYYDRLREYVEGRVS